MKSLTPVIRLWKLAYLRWALREICPMHKDVPFIVNQINDLERQA